MNKKITLFVFLCLCGSSLFSTSVNRGESADPKIITLKEQEKSTRSVTIATVAAFLYNEAVMVTVGNYAGGVSILITGSGGMRQQSFNINNTGECVVDISTFGEGLYYIQVILESVNYEGYFEYRKL